MEVSIKINIEEVEKVWGYEEILVNNDKYCGKLLHLDKGARCSFHYHPVKQETFHCLEGEVLMIVKSSEFILKEPYTIDPNTTHSFYGITDAIILEVSTPHSDEDVVRINESIGVEAKV